MLENIIFIVVLVFSVVVHELAHAYAADALGDPTPRLSGRLTMNPLKHLDWIGSLLVPGFLILTGAPFLLGWAKPVPFNPYQLNSKKWGGALVALAGPASNIALALVFALVLKFFTFSVGVSSFFSGIILTNVALAVFNMVPIPPLDGHHVLYALIGEKLPGLKDFLKRYGFVLLILFIVYGFRFISPAIMYVYQLLIF